MQVFLIINLFLYSFSVIPIWNLKNSSIDLLKDKTSYEYVITNRSMYDLQAKLTKKITKEEDGTITHENTLNIYEKNQAAKTKKVSFENIESFYKLDNGGRRLLCPKGKFHPINLNDAYMNEITNNDFSQSNNWDLKCYNHNGGIFFAFYLNNGDNQVYDLKSDLSYEKLDYYRLHRELYDFKLINKENGVSNNPYPMYAIINWNNKIQILSTAYNIENRNSEDKKRQEDKVKELISIKNHTQGYFSDGSNHFYYMTYNDISDFSSGYSTRTFDNIVYALDGNIPVDVKNNLTSPFKFIDDISMCLYLIQLILC